MGNLSFGPWTTVPENSEVIVPLDTTRIPGNSGAYGSMATSDARLAPGGARAQFAGGFVTCVISIGAGDSITVNWQVLKGNAGTESDWANDPEGPDAGATTQTASTDTPYEWKPSGNDYRIKITAGANNPASIYITGTIHNIGGPYDFGV